jgi:hypothetical protein
LRLAFALALLASLAACEPCDRRDELRVSGPTPYVRCLAAGAPADGVRQLGAARIESRDGHVRVDGLHAPLRLAAFSGPAFAEPPGEPQLAAIRAAAPALLLVLGNIGDTQAVATGTLAALGELGLPTVILAGGRDSPARLAEAVRALSPAVAPRIIDVTGAGSVRIGSDVLVPVAGAFEGRYALDADACGYAASDLDRLASKLGDTKGRRWLIAWEAPAGQGEASVTWSEAGIDVGGAALARFANDVGARGGLFAWPHAQLLRPSAGRDQVRATISGQAEPDLRLVVPRLVGPAMERSDGSRVLPGFALLELGQGGLRVAALHAAP